MADLRSRGEVIKLATELGAPVERLEFLAEHDTERIRELRTAASAAMFGRNEERLLRLAALANLIPPALTAKIAAVALGPMLSARVAGVLNPTDAVKLAKHLDPVFLTELSKSLDPKRVEPILRRLPVDLVVDVGRRLLAQGEHLTLGRFTSAVDVQAALGVVEGSDPAGVLQVALNTEDPGALEAIVAGLDDSMLAGVLRAAVEDGAYDDALALLASLSTTSTRRLIGQLHVIEPGERNELVAAVVRNDAWHHILPAIEGVEASVLHGIVNVEATLDAAVIDRVLEVAREHNLGPAVVTLVLALDNAHLDVISGSTMLAQADVRTWLVENAGVADRLVLAVLAELGFKH